MLATPDSAPDALDQEIADLQSQVALASKTLHLRASALLTAPAVAGALADAAARTSSSSSTSSYSSAASYHAHHAAHTALAPALVSRLRSRAARQAAHAQQCLYRLAGGGVSAFRVRDPDPCAVDGGRVLGLRFEVMSRGRFFRTYFVLLNRPYGREGGGGAASSHTAAATTTTTTTTPATPRSGPAAFLRVHRHTLPAHIAVGGLAARHLPPPSTAHDRDPDSDRDPAATHDRPAQNLILFARALRRELVAYHNRLGVVADAKRAATSAADDTSVVDVRTADADARQVHVEWADGRTGRVALDDGGAVGRTVVFGPQGRLWAAGFETAVLRGSEAREVDGLLARLGIAPGGG